jgi:hypothetical protein
MWISARLLRHGHGVDHDWRLAADFDGADNARRCLIFFLRGFGGFVGILLAAWNDVIPLKNQAFTQAVIVPAGVEMEFRGVGRLVLPRRDGVRGVASVGRRLCLAVRQTT